MSMSVLRDGKFEFRDLRSKFSQTLSRCFAYCIAPLVNPLYRSYEGITPYVGWEIIAPTSIQNSTGKAREDARTRMILCVDGETYPSEFLDDLPDLPPWWGIRPITPSEDDIPPELKILVLRMLELVNYVGQKFFRHVCSSANLQQAVCGLAPPDKDSGYRARDHAGPLDGQLKNKAINMSRLCTMI
jgi:hypothetical protein